MRKTTLTFLLALTFFGQLSAQLQSPEQFLGYPLGSRLTPHHLIVDYFRQAAAAVPAMVKLQQYGVTNEGRPLILAIVSDPANMSRLDAIRQNNLRRAGLGGNSRQAVDDQLPVIVWLSYNVHGNEASSSEAALLTLFQLVNPDNADSKAWLKNTVVILDPCINPDGRDRYVNWYNSVRGVQANPLPFTREHQEPWPGGRSNHYYFDLNRDWAWQTQLETRQRLQVYNQWLPEVHVDFHEQSYNDPYYFAPAAEPYHDIITPWQREFQEMIGRNNARYFDQQGWLFFTKERFDLFYPSYGDTYPTYRGAIGMTFEQGGGPRGGTAVITRSGDTLRLYDRLIHHYTTGLSTIETSSREAAKLISAFEKYYKDARNTPPGAYKAYLLKYDGSDRLRRLEALLNRNEISWSYALPASYTGFNYFSGKNENVRAEAGDLVINANQPNAHLLSVLLERNSKISDSATYDITAWSLPFAYGIQTYGLSQYVTQMTDKDPVAPAQHATLAHPVALAIRWTGLNSAQCLAALLQQGIKVRYADEPFTEKGKRFDRGTLLLMRAGNEAWGDALWTKLTEIVKPFQVETIALESGMVDEGYDFGSGHIHFIKAPRVTLLAGPGVSSLGVGEVWQFFDQQVHYPLQVVDPSGLNEQVLQQTDVLILPDGNYGFLADKKNNELLKGWVQSGGRLIALENAVSVLSSQHWGIREKISSEGKVSEKNNDQPYAALKKYADRERDPLSNYIPGSIFRISLDPTHPLAFGYPDIYFSLRLDDHLYRFFDGDGWNVGVIKKDSRMAGFVGADLSARLEDALVFGVQEMGQGTTVYMADNPLFRSFWENGKLMFCNAVFLVGQ